MNGHATSVYSPCEVGFSGLLKIYERQYKSVFPNPASVFLVPQVVQSVSEFFSQNKKYMFPQTT